MFDGSEGHCKELYLLLHNQSPGLFQQQSILNDVLYTDGTKSGLSCFLVRQNAMIKKYS